MQAMTRTQSRGRYEVVLLLMTVMAKVMVQAWVKVTVKVVCWMVLMRQPPKGMVMSVLWQTPTPTSNPP